MRRKTVLSMASSIPLALGSLFWSGLRVQPAPFSPVPRPPGATDTLPLPQDLPKPVERFYRLTYGERVPLVRTAVFSGRGWIRLNGITFAMRCRFMHEAARNFHSYFELTLFGKPIFKVNEHYVAGKFRQELPFSVEEGEPKNDHSAALRMYAEWVLWAPAMLLTDPNVRWKAVDESMALLSVPVGQEREHLVVRFDPETGKAQYVEAMKYKQPTDMDKTLWVNAIWLGDKPWAEFTIEDTVYNAEVDTSLERKGPRVTAARGTCWCGN